MSHTMITALQSWIEQLNCQVTYRRHSTN